MKKTELTERSIQTVVYRYCAFMKSHRIVVPNSCLFAWEADMLSVTRSGRIHEFEIKVTRSDFAADKKKKRSKLLLDPFVTNWGTRSEVSRPNFFHYVVPEKMVAADEVPEYAGLMYIREESRFPVVVKDPRLLHKGKIEDRQITQLTASLAARFWQYRLKDEKV